MEGEGGLAVNEGELGTVLEEMSMLAPLDVLLSSLLRF